jgi:heptosyltransferase-2
VGDSPFQRALVIRGGALGDFLLTMPVLAALREAAPAARIEALAYPSFTKLAAATKIIDAARSIEYGPLAGFFSRGTELNPELRKYFGSFDLIISYLYDPDGIFAENIANCGAQRFIPGSARLSEKSHAIDQLATPLAELGLPLASRAVTLSVQAEKSKKPTIALHPGSGSHSKNWAPDRWQKLVASLLAEFPELQIAVIGGEADAAALASLRQIPANPRLLFWENLPLDELAGRLAGSDAYVGHDTGVSHLAAAVGCSSLLLFGPTEPGLWAPPHQHVRILRAPDNSLDNLPQSSVANAVRSLLSATGLAALQSTTQT